MLRSKQKLIYICMLIVIFLTSCSKDNEKPLANGSELEDITNDNLYSGEVPFEKYVDFDFPLEFPESSGQIDITVIEYPYIASYCKFSSSIGELSPNKLYLENETTVSYILPDNKNVGSDIIEINFYDDIDKIIITKKITVTYNSDEQSYYMTILE